MKILWITSAYPWHGQPYGGIFFQTQAQALARQGVGIHVDVAVPWIPRFAAWLSPRYALQGSAPREQMDESLAISRIPYFDHRYNYLMGRPHLGLRRQVLKHLDFRPDLIHGHYAYPIGLAAVHLARRFGIPSVITLHGSDVNEEPTRSRMGGRHFLRAVTSADHVICVSRALGERTRQLAGISPEYMPLGINLRRFPCPLSREQARSALELPQGRPVVLYIGFLHSSKGVPVAQEALAHPSLAGVTGVFVGDGPSGPALAAQDNCRWQKGVPNHLIPQYLAAADVLILPSFAEGLPTVLVEAGACGTPVIASDVGGIPELLRDDRGLLIPPGSAEALRAAILESLAAPEAARARAGRLRTLVAGTFDADRNAEALRRVYQTLIGTKGKAPG